MSHGFINNYMNPWNIKNIIDIPTIYKDVINAYITRIMKIYVKHRKDIKLSETEMEARNYIEKIYNEGYGIRTISNSLGISHNIGRTLLINWFKIKTRKGLCVVTDKVREFRSKRITGNLNPWYNWPLKGKIKNSRGIQGWFLTKNNEYVWLRSSWEYIYAKWLDSHNIEWKFENKVYNLTNGEHYLPDFFIYQNNQLSYVVEIKGYNKNSLHKAKMLENEYGIKVILIENIKNYCKDYQKELSQWKNIRLSEKK